MNVSHILFPTDRSVLSLRPLERAPELFEDRDVTLMCVLQPHTVPPVGAPLAPPLEVPGLHEQLEAARVELEEMAASLPGARSVKVEVFSDPSPAKAIARWAGENNAGLIVLSTHGRTGLRRLAIGSVAEGVLRHASVPVLAFPAREGDAG